MAKMFGLKDSHARTQIFSKQEILRVEIQENTQKKAKKMHCTSSVEKPGPTPSAGRGTRLPALHLAIGAGGGEGRQAARGPRRPAGAIRAGVVRERDALRDGRRGAGARPQRRLDGRCLGWRGRPPEARVARPGQREQTPY